MCDSEKDDKDLKSELRSDGSLHHNVFKDSPCEDIELLVYV